MTIYPTNGSRLFIGGPITIPAQDTDFTEALFAGQTYAEVGEVENLGSLGDTSAQIVFSSVNANRDRTLKGTRNAGTMEVVCGVDYADPGQLALIAAERTNFSYAFKVVANDAPPPKLATVTISIAAPGVVTWAAHGLVANTPVVFTTTGALPTGLTAGTTYYVSATGLTSGAFSVAATAGGSAITTTGTQSGVQTATTAPVGSHRLFGAAVGAVPEAFDAANNVIKFSPTLWINSRIIKIAPLG